MLSIPGKAATGNYSSEKARRLSLLQSGHDTPDFVECAFVIGPILAEKTSDLGFEVVVIEFLGKPDNNLGPDRLLDEESKG